MTLTALTVVVAAMLGMGVAADASALVVGAALVLAFIAVCHAATTLKDVFTQI